MSISGVDLCIDEQPLEPRVGDGTRVSGCAPAGDRLVAHPKGTNEVTSVEQRFGKSGANARAGGRPAAARRLPREQRRGGANVLPGERRPAAGGEEHRSAPGETSSCAPTGPSSAR